MNLLELLEAVEMLQGLELKRSGVQIGYSSSSYTDCISGIIDLVNQKVEIEKGNATLGISPPATSSPSDIPF
jgi:hypothetical protein